MYESPDEAASIRHLLALGYVDPDIALAREAALRSQLEAEFQQAVSRYRAGEFQDAKRRFEQLTNDDPNWVAPRQLLAEIHYRTGDGAAAQLQLEWLTLHGVEHPRLALIAGALALANRDFSQALEALEYASFVEPELPSVQTLLGTVLLRQGELDKAEKALQTAIQQRPTDAVGYDCLAAIAILRGDFEVAANFALESLEHDLQSFRAHYHLGIALAHLDRPDEAIVALETAARVDTSRAAPYYWLSKLASRHLGDNARAAQYRKAGGEVIRLRRDRKV